MSCVASADMHEGGASAAWLGSGTVASARAMNAVVHQVATRWITGHSRRWFGSPTLGRFRAVRCTAVAQMRRTRRAGASQDVIHSDAAHCIACFASSSTQAVSPSTCSPHSPGSKMHVLSDANGLPLLVGISAGNTHDSEGLKPMIAGHQTRHDPHRGRYFKPQRLHADKAYDAPTCADGSDENASEYASPAKASSPASD